MISLQSFLILNILAVETVNGFLPSSGRAEVVSTLAMSATTSADPLVQVVDGGEKDPRVLDVATFRNSLKNPVMMVERAKSKRDAVDTTAAALDGLKIGLLYVGPLIAGFTYVETNDITNSISNYATLGGGLGIALAANNYMGRGVHVPDIPEATK